MLKKVIVASAVTLGLMHAGPGLNAFAEKSQSEQLVRQVIANTLDSEHLKYLETAMEEQEMTWSDVEKLDSIAQQSLTLSNDNSYSFDYSKAVNLGATPEQAENMKTIYESLNQDETIMLEKIKNEQVEYPGPDPSPQTTAVVIGIGALINALIALGLAWLVKEILNLGAYLACKKWKNSSKSPGIFKSFCNMKGW